MNLTLWFAAGLLAAVALLGGVTKTFVPKDRLASQHGGEWTAQASVGFVKTLGVLELLAAVGLILPAVVDVAPVVVPVTAACWVLLMVGAMITTAAWASSGSCCSTLPISRSRRSSRGDGSDPSPSRPEPRRGPTERRQPRPGPKVPRPRPAASRARTRHHNRAPARSPRPRPAASTAPWLAVAPPPAGPTTAPRPSTRSAADRLARGSGHGHIGGVYLPSMAVQPPSTTSWVPVTKDEASDAR